MAQAKKKQSEKDKILLEQKKQKKIFFDKLKYYCNLYGGSGTYNLLPEKLLNIIFQARHKAERIISGHTEKLSQKELKKFKELFKEVFEFIRINEDPKVESFTLRDYITIGLTIRDTCNYLKKEIEDDWAIEFTKRLETFTSKEFQEKTKVLIINIMYNIQFELSDLRKKVIWFEWNLDSTNSDGQFEFLIEIHKTLLYPTKLQIDNAKRIAYRLVVGKMCYKMDIPYIEEFKRLHEHDVFGFCYAKIKPSQLGNKSDKADIEVPVYIAPHAFVRMQERLDCVARRSVEPKVYWAFYQPEITILEENKALFLLRVNLQKVGYLLAEYMDGFVLVRTFLFLTNNGTPEGKKLYELTGLKKLDKKYLAIDKLSSFINSDISKNESIKQLFEDAGCDSLIDTEKKIFLAEEKYASHSIANIIEEYLKKEEYDEDLQDPIVENNDDDEINEESE